VSRKLNRQRVERRSEKLSDTEKVPFLALPFRRFSSRTKLLLLLLPSPPLLLLSTTTTILERNRNNNIKGNKLMLMFLTTAEEDLLMMKTSHVHSFSELQCWIYFHSEGDGLKAKPTEIKTCKKFDGRIFMIEKEAQNRTIKRKGEREREKASVVVLYAKL